MSSIYSSHKIQIFGMGRAFEIIRMKIESALQLKNRQRYFHETEYKYKLVSDNVQRTRTVTPSIIFVKLCPFEIFQMKTLSTLYI